VSDSGCPVRDRILRQRRHTKWRQLTSVWTEWPELRLNDCSKGLGSRSNVLRIAGRAGGRGAGGPGAAATELDGWRSSPLVGVGGRAVGERERGGASPGDGAEESSVPEEGARDSGGGLGFCLLFLAISVLQSSRKTSTTSGGMKSGRASPGLVVFSGIHTSYHARTTRHVAGIAAESGPSSVLHAVEAPQTGCMRSLLHASAAENTPGSHIAF
jgi:hypothetical protein